MSLVLGKPLYQGFLGGQGRDRTADLPIFSGAQVVRLRRAWSGMVAVTCGYVDPPSGLIRTGRPGYGAVPWQDP
jgi:hypothetical protein